MADKRITDLIEIMELASDDELAIYDKSSTIDNKVALTDLITMGAELLSNANDDTATLTNKAIDSDDNTITNIVNADIKSTASIDATKLGNGDVTNTELSYINSVTSNVQNQLNALGSAGKPQISCYFERTSDGSKLVTITESEIQTALGLSTTLPYSISYYTITADIKSEVGTIVHRYSEPDSVTWTAQTDNSIVHLDKVEFTMASASTKYLIIIQCQTIDAS